ncbi:MAG: C40 family peptidase [Spirochaetales bacterium]|nr:C40 family peptidase [Spirochaetales bacterium]
MKRTILPLLFFLFTALLSAGPAEDIIRSASELVGTPYRYGGASPSGFDCSGLLYYLYAGLVPSFPRVSTDQARSGSYVEKGDLLPGDLVFYATGSNPSAVTHAALYIGSNTVIQAVSEGPQTGVVITDMDERYWKNRYVTSRRVLALPSSSSPVPSESVAVAKEKVIDSKGQEKTVVTIGTRRFSLMSWEEWFAAEQEAFEAHRAQDDQVLEKDLSDFEKWKKQNSPG